jgi:hypothetical protein
MDRSFAEHHRWRLRDNWQGLKRARHVKPTAAPAGSEVVAKAVSNPEANREIAVKLVGTEGAAKPPLLTRCAAIFHAFWMEDEGQSTSC